MPESKEESLRKCRRSLLVILVILLILCIIAIIVLAVLLHDAEKEKDKDPEESAIHPPTTPKPCPVDTSCYTPACLRTASHMVELLNKSAATPCEDFYTFACSNFKHLYPLEPDESEVNFFRLLYRQNMDKLQRVVEAVPSTTDPQHYESKMKNFYRSCLDNFQRTGQKGVPFLEKVVEPSGGWWVLGNWPPSGYTFQDQLQKVHVDFWTDAFFTFRVGLDYLDWTNSVIEIYLGGLGMTYWSFDDALERTDTYRAYIETVGRLLIRDAQLGLSDGEENDRLNTFVDDVLEVEGKLAELLWDSAWERDPYALDKRLQLQELNNMSNGALDWVEFFKYTFNKEKDLVDADTYVVLHEQEYTGKFTEWISTLSPNNRTLNSYMIWRLAHTYINYLSCEYQHAYNTFVAASNDALEVPAASVVCLNQLQSAMRDAMGALFVRDHFLDPNRDLAYNLTDYIMGILLDNLNSDDHWMSESTRQTARQKLEESLIKLGYPDYMLDQEALDKIYESLTVDIDDYFGSVLSTRTLYLEWMTEYLEQPDDRALWYYAMHRVVVEYYSPWKELIIPAGTLQFPFFDHSSPAYMNFGAMGSLVGRELTHAVDEFGSLFLINGSQFGEWWSEETRDKYDDDVLPCITEQYSSRRMSPLPDYGIPVNYRYNPHGLSEASGVRLAYQAYQKWITDHGPEPTIPGHNFTNNQLFFLSYAQAFCSDKKWSLSSLLLLHYGEVTDRLRVNGALAQVPEFKDAFGCSHESNMVDETRCDLY